jgi:imidazole glycerol-phosphate synthase subunit HisH
MQNIAIVDYGMGNLRSVVKAVEYLGGKDIRAALTADSAVIKAADRIIFPGQGAIGYCMAALQRLGLDTVISDAIGRKPFLGICVGFQALLSQSDEDGGTPALDILPGGVHKFPPAQVDPKTGERLKVPHMGWNQVYQQGTHPLWEGIADGHRFYFVHSFYVQPELASASTGRCHYGLDFAAAAAGDGWFATQFHPEKSADAGLQILRNFVAWDGSA